VRVSHSHMCKQEGRAGVDHWSLLTMLSEGIRERPRWPERGYRGSHHHHEESVKESLREVQDDEVLKSGEFELLCYANN
jgi:hypothetical protein